METQGASGVVWCELDALRGSRLKHTKSTVFIISDVVSTAKGWRGI